MYKNLGVKPYLMPMPVLIIGTYNQDGTPNAMNATYGSMRDNHTVSLYLERTHKTVANLLRSKAFTIHLADWKNLREADYVGCISGNDVANKVEQIGWAVAPSKTVDAPIFTNFPLVMECALVSYTADDGHLVGEVKNVSVEEQFLDAQSRLNFADMGLLTYNPAENTYHIIGDAIGGAFQTDLSEVGQEDTKTDDAEEKWEALDERKRKEELSKNSEERIARVQRMEKVMNELASLQAELNQALDHFEAFKEQSDAFDAYYSSRDWMDDNEASSLGVIPEEIHQGVLSEDLPYDVLCENDELGRRMRDLARRLLLR